MRILCSTTGAIMSADETSDTVSIDATFNFSGGAMQLRMSVPAGPTRPVELLPILRSLTDSIVSAAVEQATRSGQTVSCCKGCGACCRQIVPLSETEARKIRDLVATLPEPRRAEILSRFAAARERLEQAGLIEILLAPERAEPEQIKTLILEYFRLGIPCPFLEEESCSIHPDRPVPCREYLVVSPAENCARLNPETVRPLKMPLEVSTALQRFDADEGKLANHWIPMTLALEWAEAHPDVSAARPGPELLHEAFDRMME
jgi:Fe-S-cluster containining protein